MSSTRRRFLQFAGGAAGLSLIGCGTKPKPVCTTPATGAGLHYCLVEDVEVRLTGAALLQPGQMMLFNVDDSSGAVVLRDDKGFYALSAICTHQCCLVTACENNCTKLFTNPGDCSSTQTALLPAPGKPAFVCACHGSEFTGDGSVLFGPATQPLPAVALRVDGNDVVVDLSRAATRDERVT